MVLKSALLGALALATPLMARSFDKRSAPLAPRQADDTMPPLPPRLQDEAPTMYAGDNEIQQITWFGERPTYRRDGRKLAFMSKSYGDVFEMDLRTQRLKLLTGWAHAGFLRAQYLVNGDLLLIGSKEFKGVAYSREHDMQFWVLTPGDRNATAIDQKTFEGVAISIHSNKIAWSNSHGQYPDLIKENETIIYTGEIDYSSGTPKIINKKEIIRDYGPDCILEPQDFWNNDTELTYTCYTSSNPKYHYGIVGSVNLETKERTVLREEKDVYMEIEGMFPNEKYSLVEADISTILDNNGTRRPSVAGTEIYMMGMDQPNSTYWRRLTWFSNEYPWKAGNPVISPDGRTMAVHSSRSDKPAGVGYGMYLVDIDY